MVKCGGMSSLEQVSLGPASVGLGWKSRSKKDFSETGPFSAFSAFNDRREKRKQNLAQSWREGLEP